MGRRSDGVDRVGDDREPGRPARRAALAAFLRAQRARLRPADVGLPEGSAPGRRRTPGLRREEVAHLSGVGVTWYTWLEQGRDISASAQVVDALARALLLDADQHRHLRDLAGLTAPERDRFASEFYRALVDGYPAEAAVVEARKALNIKGWDWSTYVPYASNKFPLHDLKITAQPHKAAEGPRQT